MNCTFFVYFYINKIHNAYLMVKTMCYLQWFSVFGCIVSICSVLSCGYLCFQTDEDIYTYMFLHAFLICCFFLFACVFFSCRVLSSLGHHKQVSG